MVVQVLQLVVEVPEQYIDDEALILEMAQAAADKVCADAGQEMVGSLFPVGQCGALAYFDGFTACDDR